MKRLAASIVITAALVLTGTACTVEVKDDATTTTRTSDTEPTKTEWCAAYLVWWNAPADSAEETAATDEWVAVTERSTDPAVWQFADDAVAAVDMTDLEAVIAGIDDYCDIVPDDSGY